MVKRACTLLPAIALATAGCWTPLADMAMRDSIPDPRAWASEASRAEFEREVGQPVSSRPTDDGGRIDTYEFTYRPPSDPPGPLKPFSSWSHFHASMTVLTLGAWNIIGLPIELARGETRRLVVTYGPDDRVVASQYQPPESLPVKMPAFAKTSGKGRAIPVAADQVELVDLSVHREAPPALLTGRLRNRSTLLLIDVSIKVSFYDGQGKVGEATVGGFADRLRGKTTGEKGISDMGLLPGEGREFAVRFENQVPAHYTRIEHHVFDAWGTPPAEPEAVTGPEPAQP